MSEFYIKALKARVTELEQTILVTVSSFKSRAGMVVTAEYDGVVIASETFNLSIGETTARLSIEELPDPRKILVKLIYRDFVADRHEIELSPYPKDV